MNMNLTKLLFIILLLIPIVTAQDGVGVPLSREVVARVDETMQHIENKNYEEARDKVLSSGGGGTITPAEPSCLSIEKCQKVIDATAKEVKVTEKKKYNQFILTLLIILFVVWYFRYHRKKDSFDNYFKKEQPKDRWVTPMENTDKFKEVIKQTPVNQEPIHIGMEYFNDDEYNKSI